MGEANRGLAWTWVLAGGCLLVAGLVLLWPKDAELSGRAKAATKAARPFPGPASTLSKDARRGSGSQSVEPARPAEEVVATKVVQYAAGRRAIVEALAKRDGFQVPQDVLEFFAAAGTGRWEDVQRAFEVLKSRRQAPSEGPESEILVKLWGPILETYGVAEIAHKWPARELLDYGETILGSLSPGTVYLGGTDAGRFIPSLLNETGDGQRHIVLTQNAFADGSYADYVRFLYGDQLNLFTADDSQQTFQEYVQDAQKRALHDTESPDEPRQLKPGEDVKVTDGRVQISGQVAVMGINEQLLQALITKNPGVGFAMEESFPFKSFNANAIPSGPLLQLNTRTDSFSAALAAEAAGYWREKASALLANDTLSADSEVRQAYAKMAAAQAGLMADRKFTSEAEETYRLAVRLAPSNPECVYRLSTLLAETGRTDEARRLIQGLKQD